jgi:hypothetical protein
MLAIVVVKIRFSTPSTVCGPETHRERLGFAEAATADRVRMLAKVTQIVREIIAEHNLRLRVA